MDRFILQGGGEHARVVLDALLSNGASVIGIFDPKYDDDLFGVPQLGNYDPAFEPGALAIVAIGNNQTRKKVAAGTSHGFAKCIHRSAVVSPFASVDAGIMILHGAVIQAGAKLGRHAIINTRASVDHDCVIGDFVHIAPGATLCGTVQVGEGTLIGAGATVLPGIQIGKWCTIGAGAVVTRNVEDDATVMGNPAKVITTNR
ncbi:MAG: acetyltransferase [Cyclobacteriaceae bacterium]